MINSINNEDLAMNQKYVRYIIKVLEPKQDYLLDFVDLTLKGCQSQAQSYLDNCPRGTDYMYINTAYTYERTNKYVPYEETA